MLVILGSGALNAVAEPLYSINAEAAALTFHKQGEPAEQWS